MNIRVDFNKPIQDGTEVVFRSPVDCSQVTGLIVYYTGEAGDTASMEFAFADAHGNNVGDIDNLFAENVVVKVILDISTSMAFVQNADTNAYIERTFVKTVNNTAPDEGGNVNVPGLLVVTVDEETNLTSHTPREIYDHVNSGGTAVLNRYGENIALSYCGDYGASFIQNSVEECLVIQYVVNEDRNWDQFQQGYYVPNFAGCSRRVLLWTNPDPDNTDFQAQDIPINLDGYVGAEIITRCYDDGCLSNSGFIPKAANHGFGATSVLGFYGPERTLYERSFTVNNSYIECFDGFCITNSNLDNAGVIPMLIYGVEEI